MRCFEGDFEQRRRPVALDDTIEAAARAGAPTGRSRTLHCSYERQLARHGSCSLPCRWASRGAGSMPSSGARRESRRESSAGRAHVGAVAGGGVLRAAGAEARTRTSQAQTGQKAPRASATGPRSCHEPDTLARRSCISTRHAATSLSPACPARPAAAWDSTARCSPRRPPGFQSGARRDS